VAKHSTVSSQWTDRAPIKHIIESQSLTKLTPPAFCRRWAGGMVTWLNNVVTKHRRYKNSSLKPINSSYSLAVV